MPSSLLGADLFCGRARHLACLWLSCPSSIKYKHSPCHHSLWIFCETPQMWQRDHVINIYSVQLCQVLSVQRWATPRHTRTESPLSRGDIHVTIDYGPGLLKTESIAKEHLSHLLAHFSEEAVDLWWFCLTWDFSLQQVCGTKWIRGVQGSVHGDVCASTLSIYTAPF